MTVAAMEESGSCKKPAASALTIDRAAFLLLRVKKAFKKKKQQRKEKKYVTIKTYFMAESNVGGSLSLINLNKPVRKFIMER
jgi:flagellar basal body rod protein FlgF